MSITEKMSNLILSLGLVLTVCTQLRFESIPIGPGEMLIFIWLLGFYIKFILYGDFSFSKQELVIPMSMLGIMFFASCGLVISGEVDFNEPLSNFRDYIAILLSFFLVLALEKKKDFLIVVKYVTSIGTMFFFLLLCLTFAGVDSIGGMNLLYSGLRFSGGAHNPNQLAVFIAAIPFVSILLLKLNIVSKLAGILYLVGSICVGLGTMSDAILGTWILMICFILFVRIVLRDSNFMLHKTGSIVKFLFVSSVVLLVVLLVQPDLLDLVTKGFNTLDQDSSRVTLWKMALTDFAAAPLFGHGLGGQVSSFGYKAEAHNTFIDIVLQAGILGLACYIYALLKIGKEIKNEIILYVLIAVLLFSSAHYMYRQPIFHFWLVGCMISTRWTRINKGEKD